MLWDEDRKWYGAEVVKVVGGMRVKIRYDDGEAEVVDLGGISWRREAEDGDEDEAEFQSSDDGDHGDDGDDGSVFEGDEESEEDEEEEDDWMVDDDEDAEEETPKKKRGRLQKKSQIPPPKRTKTPCKNEGKVSFSPDSTQPPPASTPSTNIFSTYKLTMESGPAPAKSVTPSVPRAPLRSPTPQSASGAPPTPKFREGIVNPMGSHLHNHLSFLRPPNLRDASGTPYGHPDYNPRTLKWDQREIERKMIGNFTDAKRQWWELKSQYFDTVLLFKTGKFYEMFHMDSDVGVSALGFVHMRGVEGHSGFPESAYGTIAAKLVRAGYKVARVEQTETPAMLAERKKRTPKGVKKPQVVNREVCAVMTRGTRTYCFLDDVSQYERGGSDSSDGPLVSIKEIILPKPSVPVDTDAPPPATCEYGVSIVDAVRGVVTLGQFADDKRRSRLHTLLSTACPSEVVLSPAASADLRQMVKNCCGDVPVETVMEAETLPKSTAVDARAREAMNRPGPFNPWDVNETIGELKRKRYFPASSKNREAEESGSRWPEILRACIEGGAELALSSFGGSLFYLQRSLVDYEILTMAEIRAYVPPSSSGAAVDDTENKEGNRAMEGMSEQDASKGDGVSADDQTDHMQLDGITLENLEILVNQVDGGKKGSLWSKVMRTRTPHGQRLLKGWILRPLFCKADIDRRADAVTELVSGSVALALAEAKPLLSKVGDIERLLSRTHSMGSVEPNHPANRQVLYENKIYNKRKVQDFCKLIKGLQTLDRVIDVFRGVELESPVLKKICTRVSDGGSFPEITEHLKWFSDNFDAAKAIEGNFEPAPGMDAEFDEACGECREALKGLQDLQNRYCAEIQGARGHFKYIKTKPDDKDKYMIELPVFVTVPKTFIVKGKRGSGNKQVNKYYTDEVQALVADYESALVRKASGKERGLAAIFAKFDSYRPLWSGAVLASSMLDALSSLADVSGEPGMCRPKIVEPEQGRSKIEIVGGRHPCVETTHSGGDFVPNDLTLGGKDDSRVLLLSGPNMGGKSTLLRQTCLISIMAQIGMWVPASQCQLTPFDRIFTRLGASDKILAGQSTFFVELSECAAALRGATSRSLVIADELGRGTSTFDGTAIAHAVVQHLVNETKCLTLFSTHYPHILEDLKGEPDVRLGHMKCHVDSDSESGDQRITFLYQLVEGACPKSFGINVARLADLPPAVLEIAQKKSNTFAMEMERGNSDNADADADVVMNKIRDAANRGDADALVQLWDELQQ